MGDVIQKIDDKFDEIESTKASYDLDSIYYSYQSSSSDCQNHSCGELSFGEYPDLDFAVVVIPSL